MAAAVLINLKNATMLFSAFWTDWAPWLKQNVHYITNLFWGRNSVRAKNILGLTELGQSSTPENVVAPLPRGYVLWRNFKNLYNQLMPYSS